MSVSVKISDVNVPVCAFPVRMPFCITVMSLQPSGMSSLRSWTLSLLRSLSTEGAVRSYLQPEEWCTPPSSWCVCSSAHPPSVPPDPPLHPHCSITRITLWEFADMHIFLLWWDTSPSFRVLASFLISHHKSMYQLA